MRAPFIVHVLDRAGNVKADAVIEVRDLLGQDPTTLYTSHDEDVTTAVSSPKTDADGEFRTWVESGVYEWRAQVGSVWSKWFTIDCGGLPGPPGPEGPSGPPGMPGGSTVQSMWTWQVDSLAPPLSRGEMGSDNPAPREATELIVSCLDDTGANLDEAIARLEVGDLIHLQVMDDSESWHVYEVTDEPVEQGETFMVPVTTAFGSPPDTAPQDPVVVLAAFQYSAQGEPGPQGPPGPKGDTGPQGAPAPVHRWWQQSGDNSGDGPNTNNAVWATAKSPVFTTPADGWYRIWASFCLTTNTSGAVVTGAVMVDTTALRSLNATFGNAEYAPMTLHPPTQLTAGQKVMIGYRPLLAGKNATLVNSGGVLPVLIVEEIDPPS